MATRCGCLHQRSISGRVPNGCADWSLCARIGSASGSATAIIITPTRGWKSATRIERIPALAQQVRGARLAPQTSAWLILLTFFAIFCMIVAGGWLLGWRFYTSSMVPVRGALLRSHVSTGVFVQARGQLAPSGIERLPSDRDPCPTSPDLCAPLNEGETVKTRREAGYGPVASLVLPDETHIQLWASPTGADLAFERYQVTQWNREHQEVLLTQRAGYARYDVASG